MSEKTLGEKRVRTDFNVLSDNNIDDIKRGSAQLIDLIDSIQPPIPCDDNTMSELKRLKALSQTKYEEAAMWAVKAATIQQK